jgi:hypothetical protein
MPSNHSAAVPAFERQMMPVRRDRPRCGRWNNAPLILLGLYQMAQTTQPAHSWSPEGPCRCDRSRVQSGRSRFAHLDAHASQGGHWWPEASIPDTAPVSAFHGEIPDDLTASGRFDQFDRRPAYGRNRNRSSAIIHIAMAGGAVGDLRLLLRRQRRERIELLGLVDGRASNRPLAHSSSKPAGGCSPSVCKPATAAPRQRVR